MAIRFAFACGLLLALEGRCLAFIDLTTPFDSDQCATAIEWSGRVLSKDADNAIAQETHAEGLLCAGLADNVGALDRAVSELKALASRYPTDAFLKVYLAKALARRFPLSDEAVDAANDAIDTLNTADTGAARQPLFLLVAQQREELLAYRRLHGPELLARLAGLGSGTVQPEELGDTLLLLAQAGPTSLAAARQRLYDLSGSESPLLLTTFYRAELERDAAPTNELERLYKAAQDNICQSGSALYVRQCGIVAMRLAQISLARGQTSTQTTGGAL